MTTLRWFSGKDRFEAERGEKGRGRMQTGLNAEDLVLEVPVGTMVRVKVSDYRLLEGRRLYGKGYEVLLEKSGFKEDGLVYGGFEERFALPDLLEADVDEDGYVTVCDLDADEMEFVLARGGRGGTGNTAYKSSRLTTPWFAQSGEDGEVFDVRLELKVLADVGLVGLPNAGKSTFLSVVTRADPRIGDYPFTTLSPNLGVWAGKGQEIVLADIPGLIEDAHEGKGLGDQFLKHVERCRVLVYVLYPTEALLFSPEGMVEGVWEQYVVLRDELAAYGGGLADKPAMVVLNKIDLLSDGGVSVREYFLAQGVEVLLMSGVTHEGVEGVMGQIGEFFLEG